MIYLFCTLGSLNLSRTEKAIVLVAVQVSIENRFDVLLEQNRCGAAGIQIIHEYSLKHRH